MFETELSSFYAMMLFVFSSLVPVLNPFGGAMFFTTLTSEFDPETRKTLANKIAIYSTLTLFVCLYAGSIILNFFGISIGVLRLAGGIVLFSAGWQALNAPSADETTVPKKPKSKAAISTMAFYPFTLPLTTGPGSISVAVAIGATPANRARKPFSAPRSFPDKTRALFSTTSYDETWQGKRDSNPQPTVLETATLPIALFPY